MNKNKQLTKGNKMKKAIVIKVTFESNLETLIKL